MKTGRIIMIGVVVLVVVAGIGVVWRHNTLYPSTNDAYVGANILTVSPQVTAQVTDVLVHENQKVSTGDVLVKLDRRALSATVMTAQAQLDNAIQMAGQSGANVQAAEAQLTSAEAQLTNAEASFERTEMLFRKGDVAQAQLDSARATRDAARAGRDSAKASLNAALQALGAKGRKNAGVRAARGQLQQAQIALDHTIITAPVKGWVANLNLRPGDVVQPGQSLFSIVEDGHWWVDANFKETDINRIRPGQPVQLSFDMYPGMTLKGTVQSLGAGSGSTFSLLPPQNATGNWVKVTQRFPVRIAIETVPTDPARQLRVGASTTARVDTIAQPVPVLPAEPATGATGQPGASATTQQGPATPQDAAGATTGAGTADTGTTGQ